MKEEGVMDGETGDNDNGEQTRAHTNELGNDR